MRCADFSRNPVFALTAIVTLTLAIGATTAVFSVVDRILFRAFPMHTMNASFPSG